MGCLLGFPSKLFLIEDKGKKFWRDNNTNDELWIAYLSTIFFNPAFNSDITNPNLAG
jgi:hypothetical protein